MLHMLPVVHVVACPSTAPRHVAAPPSCKYFWRPLPATRPSSHVAPSPAQVRRPRPPPPCTSMCRCAIASWPMHASRCHHCRGTGHWGLGGPPAPAACRLPCTRPHFQWCRRHECRFAHRASPVNQASFCGSAATPGLPGGSCCAVAVPSSPLPGSSMTFVVAAEAVSS